MPWNCVAGSTVPSEIAELLDDPEAAEQWLTFVVIGAGATGVRDCRSSRVVVAMTAPSNPARCQGDPGRRGDQVLASIGKVSVSDPRGLGKLNIDVRLGHTVTGMDAQTVELTDKDGNEARHQVELQGVGGRCVGIVAGPQTGRTDRCRGRPQRSVCHAS